MDGFDAYKLFSGIRNHFTTDYDYIKYNGKTNVSLASYNRRKDRFMFDKLARCTDARLRIVCAMAEGITWVGDVAGDPGASAQTKHQKYLDATTYHFKQELNGLPQPLSVLVGSSKGQSPKLAQLYFQKKVALETLVLIDTLVDFVSIWKDNCKSDPLMQKLITLICKYRAFLVHDRDKIKQVFTEFYVNRRNDSL